MALCPDQRECKAFGVHDGTYSKYMLAGDGGAPVALHAWGLQRSACPCGSSEYGLTAGRLHVKGLFGLSVSCFAERVRLFGMVVREVLVHAGFSDLRYCCLASHMICTVVSCMGLPLAEEQLCAVDWWIAQFTKVPFRRPSMELDLLPVPTTVLVQ